LKDLSDTIGFDCEESFKNGAISKRVSDTIGCIEDIFLRAGTEAGIETEVTKALDIVRTASTVEIGVSRGVDSS
jgi:hypothetical protein